MRAGSHPDAMTTTFEFANHEPEPGSLEEEAELKPAPNGLVKDLEVKLPPGLMVDPNASPVKCTDTELDTKFECPNASVVGIVKAKLALLNGGASGEVPIL